MTDETENRPLSYYAVPTGTGLKAETGLTDHSQPPKLGDVGETAEIIIKMIADNNKLSANQIAQALSVSQRTVERYIKEFRETGRLNAEVQLEGASGKS